MNIKHYFTISFVVAITLFAGTALCGSLALAAENGSAEPKPVLKAAEEVEASVEGLVTARDENISNDLGLRIDAFKKVIELSVSEAKDLQVRTLLIEKSSKDMALWREEVLGEVENAVRFFELLKKKGVAHIKDVSAVKLEAEEFRKWREENFAPALRAVNDYSSLAKGREIAGIAKERSQKIAKDLIKLGKSGKDAAELQTRLQKANTSITAAEKLLKEGGALFQLTYILPVTTSSSEPIIESPTSSLPIGEAPTSSLATSSMPISPEKGVEASAPLSIKELVRSSFDEVKDAYRLFIEMSGLVRKSL